MVKLHMDIMREYPTVAIRQLRAPAFTMTADHAQFVMDCAPRACHSKTRINAPMMAWWREHSTQGNVRFSRAVAAYVYALPPLDAATIRTDTLKTPCWRWKTE